MRVTIETLINSIEVIRSKGLKNHNKFIATLDSHDKREQVINWLNKQSDDRSSKIKEYMEHNLSKCTAMDIPVQLVPEVRKLIAKHQALHDAETTADNIG